MTPEVQAILRAPFPPEKVGKLPRVTCGKCRDSRDRSCDSHSKSKCRDCSNWITSAHIHLDYVGHADVTDRLLEADPDWTWEPLALSATGLPALDENGGLWIKLTVGGTTRLGYGDADGKRGGNAVKELIGDALRNAGMRFGVSLDLWRKEGPVEESTPVRPAQRPAGVEWDPMEQEVLVAGWTAEIEDARDTDAITAIGKKVVLARNRKELSPASYDHLSKAGAAKKAELNGAKS